MRPLQYILLLVLVVSGGSTAWAKDLISELRQFRDSPFYARRTGLESEITGLDQDQVSVILQNLLDGRLKAIKTKYKYKDSHDRHLKYVTRDLLLKDSKIGLLIVKPEDNSPTLDELSQVTMVPRMIEIVTDPLNQDQIPLFQNALDELKSSGAQGTSETEALAFQVNAEVIKRRRNFKAKVFLTIMRNYLRPENREAISSFLNVPPIRQQYLGYPQPGFMKLIFSDDYDPTPERLYMDSMYRSCLEAIGDAQAWSYSDREARRALKRFVNEHGFEPLLPVLKWNYVRYSSLMMFLQPDDWLTKYLISTDWFKPHPILEFREPNSDFVGSDHIEWVLGLMAASEEIGDFTAETLSQSMCSRRLSGF